MSRISYKKIKAAELRDSSQVDIAVITVEGKERGPTLFMDAALHGNEPGATQAIHELIHGVINPEKLKGKIIAMPIANPLAFCMGTRTAPYDDVDLNRVFPGKKDGTITEQMAYAIFEEARKADCVIDMHGNYEPGLPFTIVPGVGGEVFSKSVELAKAYGVTSCMGQQGLPAKGPLASTCASGGILSLCVELACYCRVVDAEVDITLRGLTNVMKYLGMMDGKIEDQSKYTKVLKGIYLSEHVRSSKAGMVKYHVQPGDKLKKGDLIAEIRNVYGEKVEEILATKNAYFNAPYYACQGNRYDAFNQAVGIGDSLGTIFVKKQPSNPSKSKK